MPHAGREARADVGVHAFGVAEGGRHPGFHETPDLQLTTEPTVALGATPDQAKAASRKTAGTIGCP